MKVRMIETGQVKEVTPNEAHGLIERGVARADKMMTSYQHGGASQLSRAPKKVGGHGRSA